MYAMHKITFTPYQQAAAGEQRHPCKSSKEAFLRAPEVNLLWHLDRLLPHHIPLNTKMQARINFLGKR